EFQGMVKDFADIEIVVAPPFTALHAVAEAARHTNIGVAGQNLYWEKEGAVTGEGGARVLREAGAEYVIIGHSERRRLFQETDQTVNRKLMAALGATLTPIVCIGETLEEREAGQTLAAPPPPVPLPRQTPGGAGARAPPAGARSSDQGRPRRPHRRSDRGPRDRL